MDQYEYAKISGIALRLNNMPLLDGLQMHVQKNPTVKQQPPKHDTNNPLISSRMRKPKCINDEFAVHIQIVYLL